VLRVLGLSVTVVRQRATPAGEGFESVTFEQFDAVLPRTDWLILACPLTARTRGLVDGAALRRCRPVRGSSTWRAARVDETALIEALQSGNWAARTSMCSRMNRWPRRRRSGRCPTSLPRRIARILRRQCGAWSRSSWTTAALGTRDAAKNQVN
jgi:hypothetical protein